MKKFSSKMKASSRPTSSRRRQVTLLLTGAFLLLLLITVPFLTHRIAAVVVAPVAKVSNWFQTSSASLPQYLRNRSTLLDEIQMLKNEISTMRADRYVSERLERENNELRSLLNDPGDARVVAGVIGRPPALPYDVLLLDRGSEAGLVPGAPVFVGKQTVIGVVRSVTPQTAIVNLVTSPGFTSLVYIMGADVYAIAKGDGGGNILVGVPQGVSVTIGDVVILPSVSPGVYGVVTHIETEPTNAQQLVYVAPEIPMNSLRLVAVATEPIAAPDVSEVQATVATAATLLMPPDISLLEIASSTATSSQAATTSLPATSTTTTE